MTSKFHRRCLCVSIILWACGVSADPSASKKSPESVQNAESAKRKDSPNGSSLANEETVSVPVVKPSYGTILVQGPAGYRVTVDGVYVGEAPLPGPWAVSIGQHQVVFSKEGQPSGEVTVDVVAGQVARAVWPPKTTANDASDDDEMGWSFPKWTKADAGFASAIAGLVVVGMGVSFGMRSQALADEAAKMNIRETYRADFVRLTNQAEDASLAANLSYGIGAAALIGGLTVAIFGDGGLITVIGVTRRAQSSLR